MSTTRQITQIGVVVLIVAATLGGVSCGNYQGGGKSPSVLVIQSLSASSGSNPASAGNSLQSDVETVCGEGAEAMPTIFEDLGFAAIYMYLKDNSNPTAAAVPSNLNWVQITRYRVVYKRADGRNTPGVDVPYPFDGGVTFLAVNSPETVSFPLVRLQAKIEPPLRALAVGGAIAIFTIADVTFYGKDLAGNDVQVTGSISVNFANWGDPDC